MSATGQRPKHKRKISYHPVKASSTIRDVPGFRAALLAWYRQNRRNLPWRRTQDPYRIWLSEIMLQQTRVAAVIEHYARFLQRFPTVQSLAPAREVSVLALWSGLGYYRRARNLHAAAKTVMRDHGGEFPRTSKALLDLPGIGRYTAAAIASIAYGEPSAVVDGNVERVISRLSGDTLGGEPVWQIAGNLLSPEHPGDFNQAMMELGAVMCLPAQPKCLECPVRKFCRLRGRHQAGAKLPRQIKRQISYVLQHHNHSVLLRRRPSDAKLMPDMWELPESTAQRLPTLFSVRHSITVTDYTVRVVSSTAELSGTWVRNSRLSSIPLTGLTKKILRKAGIIQ